jgi:hypothetical protein
MASRSLRGSPWSRACGAGLAATLVALAGFAHGQDASELRRLEDLDKRCEAARARALAPVRARLVEQCVAENKRSRAECESEFSEYGNTRGTTTGAVGGQFYDLPECKAAFEARQKYRQ